MKKDFNGFESFALNGYIARIGYLYKKASPLNISGPLPSPAASSHIMSSFLSDPELEFELMFGNDWQTILEMPQNESPNINMDFTNLEDVIAAAAVPTLQALPPPPTYVSLETRIASLEAELNTLRDVQAIPAATVERSISFRRTSKIEKDNIFEIVGRKRSLNNERRATIYICWTIVGGRTYKVEMLGTEIVINRFRSAYLAKKTFLKAEKEKGTKFWMD